MRRRWRVAGAVVAISIVAAALYGAYRARNSRWPKDYVKLLQGGQEQEAYALRDRVLRDTLGREFPIRRVRRAESGETVALGGALGSRALVLFAGASCAASERRIEAFAAANWNHEGWPVVVFVADTGPLRYQALQGRPNVYFVEFPLEGFLRYVTASPTLLYVDEGERFAGYRFSGAESVMWRDAAGVRVRNNR